MSPDFETPIFYFKPYPGSEIVIGSRREGLSAARHARGVVGVRLRRRADPGPWVSREKFKLIERFKFFHELAWKRVSRARSRLQRLARYRCGKRRLPLAGRDAARALAGTGAETVMKAAAQRSADQSDDYVAAQRALSVRDSEPVARRSTDATHRASSMATSTGFHRHCSAHASNEAASMPWASLSWAGRNFATAIVGIAGDSRKISDDADHLGRPLSDDLPGTQPQWALRRLRRQRTGRRNASRGPRCALRRARRMRSARSRDSSGDRTDGIVHNKNRAFSAAGLARDLPYERLEQSAAISRQDLLGRRTTGYQAALGCRFRCTFCGVAAMFRGKTALPAAERLEQRPALPDHASSALTRCSSSTTTSSTARPTRRRCSKCWRGSSCRGGALRARMHC